MSGLGIVLIGAGLVVTLLWIAVQNLVSDEISGWLPHLAQAIVRCAANKLPRRHQSRYRAEWLAELDAFSDRKLTGLLYAFRVLRSAQGTAVELSALVPDQPKRAFSPRVKSAVDVEAATAYVKRLLERTDPGRSNWDEALEELTSALDSLDVDDEALQVLLRQYIESIDERRRRLP